MKFLENLLPTLEKSLQFTLSAQTDFGEFSWAMENGKWLDDALKTGNSSIFMSLKAFKKIFETKRIKLDVLKSEKIIGLN